MTRAALRVGLGACLLLGMTRTADAQFDRPWHVFLVPFSHTDVGYTAPVPDVIQGHIRTLDSAVAMVSRTRGNPPGERFRWTIEIPWVLDYYIAQKSPADVESLMTCIRRGEIDVGAIHFGLQSDLCGNEELVHALSFAQELRTRYGIPVRAGLIDDTPGFTWALAGLLARNDVPYLSVAMNSFLDDFYKSTTVPNLFRWQGQDGRTTLVWRSIDSLWAYLEGSMTCGVYGTASDMQSKLTAFLQRLAARGYPYDDVMINCGTGDNGPARDVIVANAGAWNASHADAKVTVSTISAFFDSVALHYAGAIPTIAGDAPNWWNWLFAPSATGGCARSREAQALLPAAETFAALASQLGAGYTYPSRALCDAYINNLYFEDHNLGAIDPAQNAPFWTLKMGWVNAAADSGASILRASVDAFAGQIPTGDSPALAVFNPLGWPRSAPLLLPHADPAIAALGPFDVVDAATGMKLAVQLLNDTAIAFLAADLPAVGYRVYRLVPRTGSPLAAGSLTGFQLQNEFYTAALDPATGSIRSLIDRSASREIAAADGQFNQYRFNSTFPPSSLTLAASDSGPVVQAITMRGSASGTTGYATTVRLWKGLRRVDCFNMYDKLAPGSTEAVDYAFHFALPSSTVHYEIPFGSVRLHDDELSGFRSNHYAVRRWINVAAPTGDYSATLALGNAAILAAPAQGFDGAVRMLISYASSSGTYRAGIGPLAMDFAVSTSPASFQADSSMRMAYEFTTPSPFRILPAHQNGSLDGAAWSFLSIDPPRLMLSTLKAAADGNGLIVRLYNPLPSAVAATLRFAGTVVSAMETSEGEADRQSLPAAGHQLPLVMKPYEVKSVRVQLSGPLAVADAWRPAPRFTLEQNFPNPFNGATRIGYTLGAYAAVDLKIFDLLGRTVAELVHGERSAGTYTESWTGRDRAGRSVASGIYFLRLETRSATGSVFRQTRPMVYIR